MFIDYRLVPILFVLAKKCFGDVYPEPYFSMLKKISILWACMLLEKDFDSYHLRILAGLLHNDEVNLSLVEKVLKELNIELLSEENARRNLMIHYIEGCFAGIYSTDTALMIVMSFYYDKHQPKIPVDLYLAGHNWARIQDGEYPSYLSEITDEEQQIAFIHAEFKKFLKQLK